MVCSQPKRGALRRQACIDHHRDPWVRHSDASPEELPEVQARAGGCTLPENICSKPAIMAERQPPHTPNAPVEPEKTPSDIPPGTKKGPPVAPKPPWFRQSLRRFLNEREQKKPARPAEPRPHMGFSRSFCGRSSSSAANLSIKEKIYSFETFSSPAGPEKVDNRKPVSVSSSCPPVETETISHSGSVENGNDEGLEDIQACPSPNGSTTDPSASEDQPPQEQPVSNLEPRDLEMDDLDSRSNDPLSSLDEDERSASPPEQESEAEGSTASPPPTCLTLSEDRAKSPQVDMDVDMDMDQELTANQPQKDLDGENLEKVLTFSNQVSGAAAHGTRLLAEHHSKHLVDG